MNGNGWSPSGEDSEGWYGQVPPEQRRPTIPPYDPPPPPEPPAEHEPLPTYRGYQAYQQPYGYQQTPPYPAPGPYQQLGYTTPPAARSPLAIATPLDWVLMVSGLIVLAVSFLPWYHISSVFGGTLASENAWSSASALVPLLAFAVLVARLVHLLVGGKPAATNTLLCLILSGLAAVGAFASLLRVLLAARAMGDVGPLGGLPTMTLTVQPDVGLVLALVVTLAQVVIAVVTFAQERTVPG
ncbi:MAG: hypothetical protein ACRDMV_12690 [Streptosporangiales bacterium]